MDNKELLKIKQSLKKIIREVISEEEQACFRIYKAQIRSLPNGQTCGVQIIGNENIINLPYSSKCASVALNDFVWVATIYNSFSNGIVWETIDFK
jgi:hypothetical protein